MSFIADMPGVTPSFTPTLTPPDGTRTTFTFAGLPAYIVWNGISQFQNEGYTITGPASGIYTVTLIDFNGNVLTPGATDDIRAAGVTVVAQTSVSQFSTAAVAYASTLNINVNAADVITILLTGNVATTNLIGPTVTGTWAYLRFTQDATGGRTVALPANLVTDPGFAIDPTPGRTTVLPITYNGTDWVFFEAPFTVTGL